MNRIVVTDSYRTPIGKTAGSIAALSEKELMAYIIKETCKKTNMDLTLLDDVIVGCCFPLEVGNLAKNSLIAAGLNPNIPAATVNRTCASSMEALDLGAHDLMVGNGRLKLIGGSENMNQNPHVMKKNMQYIRNMLKHGMPQCPNDILDEVSYEDIGITVEIMAKKKGIKQEQQDEYAINSHKKAALAWANGYFNNEVIPVHIADREIALNRDEAIDYVVDKEIYKNEKPLYFSDGSITKRNASSINDGAAAMLLTTYDLANQCGVKPLAEYVCSVTVGVHPRDIGIVAANAIQCLLNKAGLKLSDIDIIECNEAYAAQMIACEEQLQWNSDRVNISGGSLALGHPLGCTGLRICTTLIHNMVRLNSRYGIAAMCAGGGIGKAILFKKVEMG